MTVNKSQGCTFNFVGIYLNEALFSHGQLYVAMSRVCSINNFYIETNSYYSILYLVAMTSHVVWLVSRGCPRRYSFTTTTTQNQFPVMMYIGTFLIIHFNNNNFLNLLQIILNMSVNHIHFIFVKYFPFIRL